MKNSNFVPYHIIRIDPHMIFLFGEGKEIEDNNLVNINLRRSPNSMGDEIYELKMDTFELVTAEERIQVLTNDDKALTETRTSMTTGKKSYDTALERGTDEVQNSSNKKWGTMNAHILKIQAWITKYLFLINALTKKNPVIIQWKGQTIRGRPASTIGIASFRISPKDHFFDILKQQTHVSLVKCTQPWSFNWSAGNFNWSTPPFESVAIGPYIPIGPRAPTYGSDLPVLIPVIPKK